MLKTTYLLVQSAIAASSFVPQLLQNGTSYYINVTVGVPDALYPANQTTYMYLNVNSGQSNIFTTTTEFICYYPCSPVDQFYTDSHSITYYPIANTQSIGNDQNGWQFDYTTLGEDQFCGLSDIV